MLTCLSIKNQRMCTRLFMGRCNALMPTWSATAFALWYGHCFLFLNNWPRYYISQPWWQFGSYLFVLYCIPNFAMSRYMGLFVENRVAQNSMVSHHLPYINLLPFSNTSIIHIYILLTSNCNISCYIMSYHVTSYHVISYHYICLYVYLIRTISHIYIILVNYNDLTATEPWNHS